MSVNDNIKITKKEALARALTEAYIEGIKFGYEKNGKELDENSFAKLREEGWKGWEIEAEGMFAMLEYIEQNTSRIVV